MQLCETACTVLVNLTVIRRFTRSAGTLFRFGRCPVAGLPVAHRYCSKYVTVSVSHFLSLSWSKSVVAGSAMADPASVPNQPNVLFLRGSQCISLARRVPMPLASFDVWSCLRRETTSVNNFPWTHNPIAGARRHRRRKSTSSFKL